VKSIGKILLGAVALSWATASAAQAQAYLPSASIEIGSGVESGGAVVRRARTRLRAALELRIDEAPEDALVGAAIVDLEPRAAVGGELRYFRSFGHGLFAVGGGAVGYIAPNTLFGPCAELQARVHLSDKTILVTGPEVTTFVVGADLPDGTVSWQALLQVGFRADL
jgi:hypothetical protein